MTQNEEKEEWHYLAVTNFFALLRGIISKHKGDYYCLNCLHSFKTEIKLINLIKKYIKINISVIKY